MRTTIGRELNDEVFALLKPMYELVEKNVDINPGNPFIADKSYGDIDVFVVDAVNGEMILIDTKDISVGREPVEIAMEIKKFYEGDKPHVDMHRQRLRWVKDNHMKVEDVFGLSRRSWTFRAVIVTSEEVPSRYFRSAGDVEIISLRNLRRIGLKRSEYCH